MYASRLATNGKPKNMNGTFIQKPAFISAYGTLRPL